MTKKEFIEMVRAMEYLADTEIIREIKSTRNYYLKLQYRPDYYCSEDNINKLADIVKDAKKFIKDGWFKQLSNNDIIALGKIYKENEKPLYNLIHCFYMNSYKSKIGIIEFTADEKEWYIKEAANEMARLITE